MYGAACTATAQAPSMSPAAHSSRIALSMISSGVNPVSAAAAAILRAAVRRGRRSCRPGRRPAGLPDCPERKGIVLFSRCCGDLCLVRRPGRLRTRQHQALGLELSLPPGQPLLAGFGRRPVGERISQDDAAGVLEAAAFLPPGPDLQPEDEAGGVAVDRLVEQGLRDARVGLGLADPELDVQVLAQGRLAAAEEERDLAVRQADASQDLGFVALLGGERSLCGHRDLAAFFSTKRGVACPGPTEGL